MDILPHSERPLPQGKYISYGIERGTEILRYQHPNKSLSGVIFKTDGGLLTARHVVEELSPNGFNSHSDLDLDLAYKRDPSSKGLRLGYTDKIIIDDAEVVTSRIDQPNKLIVVPGNISVSFRSTPLRAFRPRNLEEYSLFVLGVSGSPIIYKDHIIGLVTALAPFSSVHLKHNEIEINAVVFGSAVRESLEQQFGLQFEEVE